MDPNPRPGLVDVHAHFLTDRYVEAARAAGHLKPDGMPGWPTWSETEHLSVMDAHGISSAMLSISSPGVHFGDDAAARALARAVNTFGAEVVNRHPNRFGHFASLPLPDVDGSLSELVYALDVLGSDGIAVESNNDGVYLNSLILEPVWEEANRRGSHDLRASHIAAQLAGTRLQAAAPDAGILLRSRRSDGCYRAP